jgi:hypothetical protein
MPVLGYHVFTDGVASSAGIVAEDSSIFLRRLDADGNYSPMGVYAAAYVTLPIIKATALESLFGFEVTGKLNSGTIDIQLSPNGTTWYYYNTANNTWTETANTWSLPSAIREGIATFPFLGREFSGGAAVAKTQQRAVQVRVRLSPDATAEKSPAVAGVHFHCEYGHDPVTDMHRTIKQFLEGIRVGLYTRIISGDGAETIVTSPWPHTVDGTKSIKAYNLDQSATTDIFSAYNAGTSTITLAADSVAAGEELRVEYYGSAPAFLGADEYFVASEIPCMQVGMTSLIDDRNSASRITESNDDSNMARTRLGPRYLRFEVVVRCVDNDLERSMLLAHAVRTAFFETKLVSVATGDILSVGDVDPIRPQDSYGTGVFSPEVTAVIWCREDYRGYAEDKLISSVGVYVVNTDRSWYEQVTQS